MNQSRKSDSGKQPYFGSVRFFRQMIITVLLLMILVPFTISLIQGARIGKMKKKITMYEAENAALRVRLEQAEQKKQEDDDPLPEQQEGIYLPQGDEADGQLHGPDYPVELPEYAALYPDMYVDTPDRSTRATKKVCYITFDDGPSARTDELLEILEDEGVKATFFVVPDESRECAERLRAIVEAGHTVGVHSYTHVYADIYESIDTYLEDFYKAFSIIRDATGIAPEVWRFPGGSINGYNGGFYQEAIAELGRRGFVYYDWNASGEDAVSQTTTAEEIVQSALDTGLSRNRAFLLLHDTDSKKETVRALRGIIRGYRDAGFTFEPLTADVVPVVYSYH